MKIEVTLIKKRENFEGPLTLHYEIIRIPPNINVLNISTVTGILKERIRRKQIIKDYWESKPENKNRVWQRYIGEDDVLIAWSPIITADALNFICQNF